MVIQNAILPVGHSSRPGGNYKKTSVTIHDTDNPNKDAGAYNHAIYAYNRKDKLGAHYYTDDEDIYITIPEQERANHCGNATGNCNSIGIEICVNSDSDYNKALLNTVDLVVQICKKYGLATSDIKQHFDWNGKNCPRRLRASGWKEFIELVEYNLNGGSTTMEYLRILKPADIAKIMPIMGANGKPESRESVQKRSGAHILLNGSTYNMYTLALDSALTINGKVYSEGRCGHGIAMKDNKAVWSYLNQTQKFPHFVGGFGLLVKNSQIVNSNPDNARRGRTAAGFLPDGSLVIYVCKDGSNRACTTGELAQKMLGFGCIHAVNYDGGDSSQVGDPNCVINSGRNVLYYVGIWLNETSQGDTYKVKASAKTSVYNIDGSTMDGSYIAKDDICTIDTNITDKLLVKVVYPIDKGTKTAYLKSLVNFKRI